MSEETIKMLNIINDKIKECMKNNNINDNSLFCIPLGNCGDYGYLSNRMVNEILQLQQENQALKRKIKLLENNLNQASKECKKYRNKRQTMRHRISRRTKQRDKYKEVIEEVREYAKNDMYYTLSDGNTSDYVIEKAEKKLLQILDKGVDK